MDLFTCHFFSSACQIALLIFLKSWLKVSLIKHTAIVIPSLPSLHISLSCLEILGFCLISQHLNGVKLNISHIVRLKLQTM